MELCPCVTLTAAPAGTVCARVCAAAAAGTDGSSAYARSGKLLLRGSAFVWVSNADATVSETIPIAPIQSAYVFEFCTSTGRPDPAAREKAVLAFSIVRAVGDAASVCVDICPRARLMTLPGQEVHDVSYAGRLQAVQDALLWTSADGLRREKIDVAQVKDVRKSPASNPRCLLRLSVHPRGAYDFEFDGEDGGQDVLARDRAELAVQIIRAAADSADGSVAGQGNSSAAGGASSRAGDVSAVLAKNSAAIRRGRAIAAGATQDGAESSYDVLAPLSTLQLLEAQREALVTNAELRAQFENVVKTGVVSSKDFWDAHRAALVDVVSRKTQAGLASAMPEAIRPDVSSEFVTTFRVSKSRMVQIFKNEPRLQEAYDAFVPLRMTREDFWRHYFTAKYERQRIQSMEGVMRVGRQRDIAGMEPAEFFEALKLGDIDLVGQPTRTAASTTAVSASFDLLASVEEDLRARRDVTTARGGYGTADSTRAYAVDERELQVADAGGAAGADPTAVRQALQRKELAAEEVIKAVNRNSEVVMDEMVPAEAGADLTDSGEESEMEASTRVPSYSAVKRKRARGAMAVDRSVADDLPDLYAPAPAAEIVAMLSVDVHKLQDTLQAGAAGNATSDDVAGLQGTPARTTRACPLDEIGLPPYAIADIFQSKQQAATAKRVMREQTQRAHDLFHAQERTREGFSVALPPKWQAFIISKFKMNKEILFHTWMSMTKRSGLRAGETEPRLAKLLQRVESEYDQLETLKGVVLRSGAYGSAPPESPESEMPPPADAETAAAATSELIEMINILQVPLGEAVRYAQQPGRGWQPASA